jgi:hypothetical protein
MFRFSMSSIPSHLPRDLDEIIARSPPIESIFQNLSPPAGDERGNLQISPASDIVFLSAEFKSLTASVGIIEPIIIKRFRLGPDAVDAAHRHVAVHEHDRGRTAAGLRNLQRSRPAMGDGTKGN